jgi:L-serine dehydratase
MLGTVSGGGNVMVVKLDGFHIESGLNEIYLLFSNLDHPHMLVSENKILVSAGINIAGLSVDRSETDEQVLTSDAADNSIFSISIREIEQSDGISSNKAIKW